MGLPDEPKTDLMAKHPDALSPDHAAELERVREPEGLSEDEQRAAQRRAEHAAHPHTQLRGIIDDLRKPAVTQADVTTKMAHLHAGVIRLAQVILSHTPAPPEEDDGQEQRQPEQHAQGSD